MRVARIEWIDEPSGRSAFGELVVDRALITFSVSPSLYEVGAFTGSWPGIPSPRPTFATLDEAKEAAQFALDKLVLGLLTVEARASLVDHAFKLYESACRLGLVGDDRVEIYKNWKRLERACGELQKEEAERAR